MISQIRAVSTVFAFLALMTGVVYPFVIAGIGGALFPGQAAGSLIVRNGEPIGSRLIGQSFVEPKYFWGRPSATGGSPYNPLASGGSNQGPLNPALAEAVKARIEALRAVDPGNDAPVPVDLVTASASGLVVFAGSGTNHELVWVTRRGAVTPVATEKGAYPTPGSRPTRRPSPFRRTTPRARPRPG